MENKYKAIIFLIIIALLVIIERYYCKNEYFKGSGANKSTYKSRRYKPDISTCNCKDPLKCCIGGKCINNYSEYGPNQCNLYSNYKKCINCATEKKCGHINTDGDVICQRCRSSETPGKSCINTPDDSPAGFGCRGIESTSKNLEPLDPYKNNGNVCKYVH